MGNSSTAVITLTVAVVILVAGANVFRNRNVLATVITVTVVVVILVAGANGGFFTTVLFYDLGVLNDTVYREVSGFKHHIVTAADTFKSLNCAILCDIYDCEIIIFSAGGCHGDSNSYGEVAISSCSVSAVAEVNVICTSKLYSKAFACDSGKIEICVNVVNDRRIKLVSGSDTLTVECYDYKVAVLELVNYRIGGTKIDSDICSENFLLIVIALGNGCNYKVSTKAVRGITGIRYLNAFGKSAFYENAVTLCIKLKCCI